MKKETLVEGIMSLCEQFVNKSTEKAITEEMPVLKSIDSDKKLFTAVVLRPDVPDAHGDIYDADVVEKACHDYNQFCRQGNLQHLIQTDLMIPVESWIAKSDMTLGEGTILKGDWVMTAKVENDEIWDMCKSGEFTGFSIGCKSLVENLDE